MNLFDVMTGKTSRMSYVNRYSSFPVNRRENVAEHSWWVSFIGLLIACDVAERQELSREDTAELIRSVLMRATLHDLSEVMSGDVIRSYKHTSDHILDAMEDADAINMEKLVEGYENVGARVLCYWEKAKDDTLAGEIVSFADMAAVAFYCREEDRSGNRAIRAVLKEAYETWFAKFHAHAELGQYITQMFPNGRFFDMLREEQLPARKMFESPVWTDGIDGGPEQSSGQRAMMRDHSEGPTAEHEYDSAAWPARDVPLG